MKQELHNMKFNEDGTLSPIDPTKPSWISEAGEIVSEELIDEENL
jgi:hypothetical protein